MCECSRDTERWLPVVGFEGFYEVSDFGGIRSLDRISKGPYGSAVPRRGRLLRPNRKPKGYLAITACAEGERKKLHIHAAVLEAFVGPRPPGMECCRGDGDPANNHLSNLRWDTGSANCLDMVKHGTHHLAGKGVKRIPPPPRKAPGCCLRGHVLKAPNLASRANKSWPRCQACERARSRVSYWRTQGLELNVDEVANAIYAEITPQGAID